MKKLALSCFAVVLAVLTARDARAVYLINPAGSTVLYSDSVNHDDETKSQTLPFVFNLFGTNYSSLNVSTNGNLNFSGNASYTDGPLSTNFAQVAPLWDDAYIHSGSGESISALSTASYYAVTWDVSLYNNAAIHEQFQSVLFGAATVVNGFQFQSGDIVFSYNQMQTPFVGNQASLGLAKGDGSYATLAAYQSTQGVISNTGAASIPTAAGTIVLFRPDGNGGYNASITAVPEPSTWTSLGIGAVAMGVLMLRRQRTNA